MTRVSADAGRASPRRSWLRRLYDWVLHWAETPYGMPALFVLAFVEASFFPVPPDVLLIALALGARSRAFLFALVCTAGSVLGGLFGWWIGMALMDTLGSRIIAFYHQEDLYRQLVEMFRRHGFAAVVVAALTPIPYKVFTIAAGAAHFPGELLVAASVIGRGARFFAVATLIFWLGDRVRRFLEKYFDLATLVFTVMLVGGFVALKHLR